MPMLACAGATVRCTMGSAPGSLQPASKPVLGAQRVCANIMDHVPVVQVTSFGMCRSPSNPVVAAATSAASGVLTPMPCVPATPAPWVGASGTVQLAKAPALADNATLSCLWAGTISITHAGQTLLSLP